MPGNVEHRAVTPLLKALRDIMRGKPVVEALRFKDQLSARNQPPPSIPGGPNHKLTKVYYYTRDARRLVQPPVEIYAQGRLESGESASTKSPILTPAKVYIPDK
ncbi:NADH dehydrogenase [ubiquinone] 1 alpha subcomplex subunit 7-like [Hylaeus volcanicus]|uniref:NADH dehydrogenase [ubiquinone] 1 alpha subcomplex subunit 7-like n=1 Tax=Hylaeus volcanicus TaxID=313075 RepID=UPI0023B8727C|nr:NADH dehydrogenase [ubiquinone] 1 alpha subcomplex subunit 7-like [Hylaeus volcanicus]